MPPPDFEEAPKPRTSSFDQAHLNVGPNIRSGSVSSFVSTHSKKKLTEEEQLREELVADKASAMFNIAFASGALVGPVLGGVLYDIDGFRFASDVIACLNLFFAVIYGVFTFLF